MKKKKSLTISNSEGIFEAPFAEINYITSNGMLCTVVMSNGEKHFISKNLKKIESGLDGTFYRVNNSCIVSHSKIKRYIKEDGGKILMVCGHKVIPSRRRISALLRWYKSK